MPSEHFLGSWEVGRLVLDPDIRSGPELVKRCLFLALLHLYRTAEISNLFASAGVVFSRLYRRFGFNVIAKDLHHEAQERYSLIHGNASDVLMALAGTPHERSLAQHELSFS